MSSVDVLQLALSKEMDKITRDINGYDRLCEYESADWGLPDAISQISLLESYHYQINHRFIGLLPLEIFSIDMWCWQEMECYLERIVMPNTDHIVPGGISLTRPVSMCHGFSLTLNLVLGTIDLAETRKFEGFTQAPSWESMGASKKYGKPFRVGDK